MQTTTSYFTIGGTELDAHARSALTALGAEVESAKAGRADTSGLGRGRDWGGSASPVFVISAVIVPERRSRHSVF